MPANFHSPRYICYTTLKEGLLHYKNTVSILKKGYQQERYRIIQLLRSKLAHKLVHEITSVDIATYRDSRLKDKNKRTGRTISPSTVRLELSLLSNFFELARIEWGFTLSQNPCKDVRKPPVPRGRSRRLTAREERQILRYAHQHKNKELYSIVVLAITTAMRQGEILSLRWENIDFRSRVAHLPNTKNGHSRDIPLSNKAREAIIRLGPKRYGKVFNYTSHGIKSTWRYMLQKLQIKNLHFHDLRHEAISRFFELGTLDMMEVAAISGHRSLSMLKRYTHLKANRLVHKLDGTKSRARRSIINMLAPYPAIIMQGKRGYKAAFPDFKSKAITAPQPSEEKALVAAKDLLLRELITLIKDGKKIPAPDHYLESKYKGTVKMIDPII